ncbi:unnamed protein product [Eruca vesicaria subsp. sativa]|uniref:Invertebrate defensins family profile domain-containing protein n=1 Tax=Eruca vesicaria subsp. sativa TaxID=29727 RepID=A0ABC8M1W6_ERUVS|nr:unnamed protein product [Eruca vesicaria subsp. sativa]
MAKSLCIVTLLMICLLISTGIPKGKAQCPGETIRILIRGTCALQPSRAVCNTNCVLMGYIRGMCEAQDTRDVCNCYTCPA